MAGLTTVPRGVTLVMFRYARSAIGVPPRRRAAETRSSILGRLDAARDWGTARFVTRGTADFLFAILHPSLAQLLAVVFLYQLLVLGLDFQQRDVSISVSIHPETPVRPYFFRSGPRRSLQEPPSREARPRPRD